MHARGQECPRYMGDVEGRSLWGRTGVKGLVRMTGLKLSEAEKDFRARVGKEVPGRVRKRGGEEDAGESGRLKLGQLPRGVCVGI